MKQGNYLALLLAILFGIAMFYSVTAMSETADTTNGGAGADLSGLGSNGTDAPTITQ